jgi:hypothetical protein
MESSGLFIIIKDILKNDTEAFVRQSALESCCTCLLEYYLNSDLQFFKDNIHSFAVDEDCEVRTQCMKFISKLLETYELSTSSSMYEIDFSGLLLLAVFYV